MSNDLKVIVASHKPYWIPNDACYLPVWVNAQRNGDDIPNGWARDDQGENISSKNANFCELTALFWAWKNLDCDWLGLAHYRRYFASGHSGDKKGEKKEEKLVEKREGKQDEKLVEKKSRIATGDTLRELLTKAPVILPKKRNYFIETNYSQYVHAHHAEDLELTRQILAERWSDYLVAYDASMRRTSGHRFNMFVMRRDLLNEYCTWLFDVLFELEKRLDISEYSTNDARVFGFVSERLLDPWIETNGVQFQEMPVVNLEDQHWLTKGTNFLKRKFVGK